MPKALLTVSVAMLVPALLGVPLIRPLVEIFSPAGRLDPPNMIQAVPLAVTVLLNGTPTVPIKELVEVMTGAVLVLIVGKAVLLATW